MIELICPDLYQEMAPHSSTLAWKIPWTEAPDRLQSMGSQRVGHDWVASLTYQEIDLTLKFGNDNSTNSSLPDIPNSLSICSQSDSV